ncbi:MAG: chemotaxis response regulator protein-glutamate methylesterase [Desulfobacterales bacterium]|nr:chemotaxis response regulator protein-glutamate methylesterase [Desulfobacterales bacterium]MBF0397340.1 chemotaxis response regulator protein-glutamate methylesterase [Desulfobacterales bacterium]
MIKVLIVDDSALVRSILTSIFERTSDIKVVATANDPYFARDKFKKFEPDVITLDIEMPKMDGLTFLEKLMNYKPTPVIMISSLTEKGAEATLKALALGAVDFVTKPRMDIESNFEQLASEIIEKVRMSAKANLKRVSPAPVIHSDQKILIDDVLQSHKRKCVGKEPVICIGASTGGTIAIENILKELPANIPGIVVVQHMPQGFTKAFSERLNQFTKIEVLEAVSGMDVKQGRAIIAVGGKHLMLQKGIKGYFVDVKDGPPVNRHKPSVDILFRSAANTAGKNAMGIILTGMGDDGAKGLKDLYDNGAFTVAQDEKTCTVFGMPRAAIEIGGVSRIASLPLIPNLIMQWRS